MICTDVTVNYKTGCKRQYCRVPIYLLPNLWGDVAMKPMMKMKSRYPLEEPARNVCTVRHVARHDSQKSETNYYSL